MVCSEIKLMEKWMSEADSSESGSTQISKVQLLQLTGVACHGNVCDREAKNAHVYRQPSMDVA